MAVRGTEHVSKRIPTILVFGMIGAGKATVANAICDKGSGSFPDREAIASLTREWAILEKTIRVKELPMQMVLIDLDPDKGRVDDLRKWLKGKHLEVCKILMVIRRETFTKQAASAFDCIMSLIEQVDPSRSPLRPNAKMMNDAIDSDYSSCLIASKITALVITCCENESMARRSQLESELVADERTKRLASFAQSGKYAVGFPKECNTKEEVWEKLQAQIEDDRERLQKLVSENTNTTLSLTFNEGKPILHNIQKILGTFCCIL